MHLEKYKHLRKKIHFSPGTSALLVHMALPVILFYSRLVRRQELHHFEDYAGNCSGFTQNLL